MPVFTAPGTGAAARFNNGALRLYEAVGIRPLEDASAAGREAAGAS